VGYAVRNIPKFPQSKGRRALDVFELVQQLHHRKSFDPSRVALTS
jgi:hypothetical protein